MNTKDIQKNWRLDIERARETHETSENLDIEVIGSNFIIEPPNKQENALMEVNPMSIIAIPVIIVVLLILKRTNLKK